MTDLLEDLHVEVVPLVCRQHVVTGELVHDAVRVVPEEGVAHAHVPDELLGVRRLLRRHLAQRVREAHVDEALGRYNEQPLMGKFRYWKGLASAQMGDTSTATMAFETIIADYADTSRLVELAREQLSYLRTGYFTSAGDMISSDDEEAAKKRYRENVKDVASTQTGSNGAGTEEELPVESRMYRYKENMQHYVAVLIDDKKIVATQLQYAIADFNMQNYSNSGYRASPLLFTDTVQMLTIHRFKNAQEAEDYRTHLLLDGGPLSKYNPKDYTVFSISTQNYNTFYNQKNIEAYKRFYEYYYKKKN